MCYFLSFPLAMSLHIWRVERRERAVVAKLLIAHINIATGSSYIFWFLWWVGVCVGVSVCVCVGVCVGACMHVFRHESQTLTKKAGIWHVVSKYLGKHYEPLWVWFGHSHTHRKLFCYFGCQRLIYGPSD